MTNRIDIDKILIRKPFFIAEAGVNHDGKLSQALKLVDVAVDSGADAVKFQTFKSEDLVTKDADRTNYQKKNMSSSDISQFSMLKSFELSLDDFQKIKSYCDSKNIMFLSTPHTESASTFLEPIVPFFKVGSGDITNIPFLKKLAVKKKIIVMSTGMSSLDEIKDAVSAIEGEGNSNIVLLHCTTNYPCAREKVNLNFMSTLHNKFEYPVGFSDHTEGIEVALLSAKLNARIIEKHFTLDKSLPGPDHKASLSPEELKNLIEKLKKGDFKNMEADATVLGEFDRKPNSEEIEISKMIRKSIVSNEEIKKGDLFSEKNLIIKRPGTGLLPSEMENIIGRKAARNINKDEIITAECFT